MIIGKSEGSRKVRRGQGGGLAATRRARGPRVQGVRVAVFDLVEAGRKIVKLLNEVFTMTMTISVFFTY